MNSYFVNPNVSVDNATLSAWAASKIAGLTVIAQAMLTLSQPVLTPAPYRQAPYEITTTTYYVDVTATHNGNGRAPNQAASGGASGAFNNYVSAWGITWGPGVSLLFRNGTSLTTAGFGPLVPNVSGTATNPIVIGLYDGDSGARLYNVVGGCSIDGLGAVSVVYNVGYDYVCVDGLEIFNCGNVTFGAIHIVGTTNHNQVLNCRLRNNVGRGVLIDSTGTNNQTEGNDIYLNSGGGILHMVRTDHDVGSHRFNRFRDNSGVNLWVWDGSRLAEAVPVFTNKIYDGEIACNDTRDSSSPEGNIWVHTHGGKFRIYRNNSRRSGTGINVGGTGATASDFTGALIENNDCNNNEFGITISNAKGQGIIQFNRVVGSGSKDGTTWITVSRYGRAIELFGTNSTNGVNGWTVRFNYCAKSYNWEGSVAGEGSEGVGVGLDNNTRNCRVYGNYCTFNEGNGISCGVGFGNLIYGNICVNNWVLPASRPYTVPYPMNQRAEILIVLSPYTKVFNNTTVSFPGGSTCGFVDWATYPSPNSEVFNNLFITPGLAGIFKHPTLLTESHNIVISGSAVLVKNFTTDAALTPGTGTMYGTSADYDNSSPFFNPLRGGACDGTGRAAPPGAVNFAGELLAMNHIGALHPQQI